MFFYSLKISLARGFVFFVLLFCFISFTSFCQTEKAWQQKKSDNGITVFTRVSENSDFKELKAVTTLKTSLTSIIDLIYDWDTYPQWVYKCGISSTLKNISTTELIHYQTVIAPFPVDNRDFVVTIKIEQNKTTKVVTIVSTGTGNFIPIQEGYVRIMAFSASWILTPKKDGSVDLVYQLLADPGGYVPAWIVNLAIVDGPYETILNMKDWVKKEKYQKAKIPFIEELK